LPHWQKNGRRTHAGSNRPRQRRIPSALTDETRNNKNQGILTLSYNAIRSDPDNRIDCNEKAHPIADFGDDMGLTYRDDGTEPKEYRMGNRMYALVNVGKYDPQLSGSWRSEYLADVADIEKVRFIERIEIPPVKKRGMPQAIYRFGYKNHTIDMKCQIWDDSKADAQMKDGPRPPFPNLCAPKMPFRSGDLVIGVDQRSDIGGPGSQTSLIPPDEWPKQWAYTIRKILSFRVRSKQQN
jgi:hypothetical protein